jgi:hypothetical protein
MNARVRKVIVWIALCVLVASLIYCIEHQKLFAQDIWTQDGLKRFLMFGAAFAGFFVLCSLWRPGLFPPIAVSGVAVYTILAVGPFAFLTVPLILLSSFALGRSVFAFRSRSVADGILSTLLGLSIYTLALSIAAHWKVNYSWVYLAVLAVPLIANGRQTAAFVARVSALLHPAKVGLAEQLASGALAFVLAAHWLVALQPEVGPDALAVHLAVPDSMAWLHRFSFDVNERLWAVMPMNGDWCFTLCYMLGGEPAARLFNFVLLIGIVTLLISAIRKWLPLAPALFLAALFLATPLVQLVTGSLFVENLWALLCLGALISIDKYRDYDDPRYLYLTFVLLGASAATKFGALAFAAPIVLISVWILWKKLETRGRLRQPLLAALCFAAFAAPPYVGAFVKTGNPAFPYLSRIFPSHFPALAAGVGVLPPGQHLGLRTPFDLTFHTSLFYEVQDGAAGFQYFVLLPLAALCLGRKWAPLAILSGIAFAVFGLLSLAIQPDVRYLYPALAPATIFLSAAVADLLVFDRTLGRAILALAVALFFLDLYFLPSSGWLHKDFVTNPASRKTRAAYLTAYAPERNVIAEMNHVHPGAPTAFFESNATAGLRAPSVTASWHTAAFNNRIANAASAADCFRVLHEFGITFVIAPTATSGIRITTTPEESFLRACTEPEFTSGKFYAGSVKATCADAQLLPEVVPGEYDDFDSRITFRGLWSRGRFPEASGGTLTWSDSPGASALLRFDGIEVMYTYTKAFNRGLAEVSVDGESKGTVDLYSPAIEWKSSAVLRARDRGLHTLEIRVTGRRSPSATGAYVDLDELIVR